MWNPLNDGDTSFEQDGQLADDGRREMCGEAGKRGRVGA